MFKVSARFDQIEELYVSDSASPELRAYAGATGKQQGRDGLFIINPLGYRDLGPNERPRVVEVYTLASEPMAAIAVTEYIAQHAAEPIAQMLKGGSRGDLRESVDSLRAVCSDLDSRIAATSNPLGPTKNRSSDLLVGRSAAAIAVVALGLQLIPEKKEEDLRYNEISERLTKIDSSLNPLREKISAVEQSHQDRLFALENNIQQLASKSTTSQANKQSTPPVVSSHITIKAGRDGYVEVPLPGGSYDYLILTWTNKQVSFAPDQLRWNWPTGQKPTPLQDLEAFSGGIRIKVETKSRPLTLGLASDRPESLGIELRSGGEKNDWEILLIPK